MADALIGATIKVTLEKALSLAAKRIDLLFGFKEDLDSMTQSLLLIRAFLDDAERRQGQNQTVQLWLNSLEGVAFDAENVLDEINYELLRQEVESLSRLKQKVCCFFSFSNRITFRWRMASKVKGIERKLHSINQKANQLGLVQMAVAPPAAAGDTRSRQTDSIVAPMIGRKKEESKIVEMLLNASEKVVSILPVIGIGGLGKTTLVKSIYNKKQVEEYFEKRIWVCVSKKIQVVELFKLILQQLTEGNVEVDDRNVVIKKIQHELKGKRYFLVLDDTWNDEPEFWNDFFNTFKGLNPTNGSWCLVTSRLQQWATTLSDVKPHFLEKLSYDDCWSIIKGKAIAGEEVPKELEDIRDRVIKRCDGLPLAANVIGGLLCSNPKEKWSSIVEKTLLSGDQSNVMRILKVSFDYLSPASVKKCFAYCSIFPKDAEMKRDSLIELWMAQGFLLSDSKNEPAMEKRGEEYIKVLLQSSLLEEIRYKFRWQGCYYKMHDLVHDLAKSISKSEIINLDTDMIDDVNQVHYLNVSSSGEYSVKLPEKISTSLRTLFLNSGISGEVLSMCQNLHVLNMSRPEIRELPTSIGKLIHLRFIDLSHSKIQTLPDSLCKLYNLQTLRLIYCSSLNSLPKQMRNLISLRHLHFYTNNADFQMPLEMGRLTCLQTLEFFNVGREKGRQIEELGSLKHLKGKLMIRNLELVKGKEEAEKANLMGKADLFSLELLWSSTNREDDNSYQNDVLESLQPCPNLQELQIENFMGDQLPRWFMNLSTLVKLELSNCQRCRELPVALGQIPSLKILYLSGLENIECIGLSFYRSDYDNRSTRELFPALTSLTLRGMKKLVEWVGVEVRSTTATTGRSGSEAEVVDVFSVLEDLTIDDCPLLTTVPSHFPSLMKLEIKRNNHISVLKNILSKATATLSCLEIEGMAELTCVSDIVAAFPPTGAFQNLKELCLGSCPNFTSIIPEAQRKLFPSLTKLTLCGMENLVEWVGAEVRSTTTTTGGSGSEVEVVDVFSVLEELEIYDCPLLATAPSHFPSLKHLTINKNDHFLVVKNILSKATTTLSSLTIERMTGLTCLSDVVATPPPAAAFQSLMFLRLWSCPNLTSIFPEALPNLTSLQELWIENCYGLTSLPQRMLQSCTSLRSLHVEDCPNLVSFPVDLQQTPSLSRFCLSGCPKLKTNMTPKGVGFLTSLWNLEIGPFSDDDDGGKENSSIYDEFDWSGLASSSTLGYLTLYGLPRMESLPHQLQYLTALISLALEGFGEIEALPDWLGNFTSLEYLRLTDCEKLRYLPSMDAMRRLTKLEDLYVRGCPLLKRRCTPPQTCGPLCSSEWSKISHIPEQRFFD